MTERSSFEAKGRSLRDQLALIGAQRDDVKQERLALRQQTQSDARATDTMKEELGAHEEEELQRKKVCLKPRGASGAAQLRGISSKAWRARLAEIAKAQQKSTDLHARASDLHNGAKQRAADETGRWHEIVHAWRDRTLRKPLLDIVPSGATHG